MLCECGEKTRVRDVGTTADGKVVVRGRECVDPDCQRAYVTMEKRPLSTTMGPTVRGVIRGLKGRGR